MQRNPTTISVVAAALIRSDGQILLHQRKLGGALGGLWEFPGGKVEPQETAVSALVRELVEELGVTVNPADLTFLSEAREAGNPHVILLYTCRRWKGEPLCLAGEAIAWVAPGDLLAHAMPPLDVPLAQALLATF